MNIFMGALFVFGWYLIFKSFNKMRRDIENEES
jgi:hypothetical protein